MKLDETEAASVEDGEAEEADEEGDAKEEEAAKKKHVEEDKQQKEAEEGVDEYASMHIKKNSTTLMKNPSKKF